MVSKFALLSNILLASAALASPSSHHRARLARRENRQSQPNKLIESLAGNVSNNVNSPNWAGAVWNEGAGTFTTVTGTFTLPTPSLGSRDSNSGASIWVGIDGNTCPRAIFQTGVNVLVAADGESSYYQAWYEWYPDVTYYFSDITISAGDVINATVTTYSANDGTAIIENVTTGKTVTHYYQSSHALCNQDAEWIVEDFDLNGVPVPFADFGTVTFYNAAASGPGGTKYTPSGANIFNINQNGEVLTFVSINGNGDTVTVDYA